MAVGEEVDEEATSPQEKVEEEEAQVELKPSEQHSSAATLPRYDYKAPSSLINDSLSGFLLTCPLKREKSAIKEAMSIFEKFMGCNIFLEEADEGEATNYKRRKLCPVNEKSEDIQDEPLKTAGQTSQKKQSPQALKLVKLAGNGLLLFISPKDSSLNPVKIVTDIYSSVDSGALKHPIWCHRIFPVQATCIMGEKELSSVVSSLVHAYVKRQATNLAAPLKFAVGYNTRRMKLVKTSSTDPNAPAIVDRDKCLDVVYSAVKSILPNVVADQKSPEVCVLVEYLPLARVNSAVAAVSVLPHALVSVKPKLAVKTLIVDSKPSSEGK